MNVIANKFYLIVCTTVVAFFFFFKKVKGSNICIFIFTFLHTGCKLKWVNFTDLGKNSVIDRVMG